MKPVWLLSVQDLQGKVIATELVRNKRNATARNGVYHGEGQSSAGTRPK